MAAPPPRRPSQPLDRNLVHRAPALAKMDGGVEGGPAVLGGGEVRGGVPVPARGHPPGGLLPLKRLVRWPVDSLLIERVRQVQQLPLVNLCRGGTCPREQPPRQEQPYRHCHDRPPSHPLHKRAYGDQGPGSGWLGAWVRWW